MNSSSDLNFTEVDADTVRLSTSGGGATVEVTRRELSKLSKYPALVKELWNAFSNSLFKKPFEKTNLTFSKRGSRVKMFELTEAPEGSQHRFVLAFYERRHGEAMVVTLFQIHSHEMCILFTFLERIVAMIPTCE